MVVRKELDVHNLREENRSLREALGKRYAASQCSGPQREDARGLATVDRVAPTNSTVLLGGESGVGKDLIARAIHEKSRRSAGPFIKINSTAIPENLLESELFGYEKGAFTGAAASKPGKFELADKGTLFLDEIGDVPSVIQVKLLRVLQEREFERLGGTRTVKVDVRLSPLPIAICAKRWSRELSRRPLLSLERCAYRYCSAPPAQGRHPRLGESFYWSLCGDSGKPVEGITPEAMQLLVNYHWPGNVRELQNIIERACALAKSTVLKVETFIWTCVRRRAANGAGNFLPEGMTLEQWEDEMIRESLRRANGNKSQAARLLGLSRNALRYRLSKIGIADEGEKEA